MIHVATVHWQDERWIEPQLRFLARHAGEHRVYASLNGVAPSRFVEFHHAVDLEGSHPEKLNQLAEVISAQADPDDLLLFLDGDAFPIGPVDASVLGGEPLAAVRRDENAGDRQPHPSFCLTTVAYWNEIGGDWREGYRWTASTGDEVSDVGGNLLGILERAGATWRPLLRSNVVDLHPLWFGIYGDVVYHHGAGFRRPLSRVAELSGLTRVRTARDASRIPPSVPLLGRVERSLRYRVAKRQERVALVQNIDEGQRLSDEVFEWIRTEDDFPRRFLER